MLADIFLVLDSGYCFVIGLVKDQNVCQISIKAYISDSFSSNIFRKIGLSLERPWTHIWERLSQAVKIVAFLLLETCSTSFNVVTAKKHLNLYGLMVTVSVDFKDRFSSLAQLCQ